MQATHVRLLDNLVERGAIAFLPASPEQAVLLDALVCHFYVWCEWEQTGLLIRASQSEWRFHLYQAAEPEVRHLLGDAAGKLWRYLCEGRSAGRTEKAFPYTPLEPGRPKSFWTQEEVGFLYQRLPSCKNLLANRLTSAGFLVVTAAFEAVENAYGDETGLIIHVG